MKPLTSEWIGKAEGDFTTARRELAVVEAPNYDAVSFHAQQCAEKYLKARLVEAGIDFPKTHDLCAVLDLVLRVEPAWERLRDGLNALGNLAVEVRYPGASSSVEEAREALDTAEAVRAAVRLALGMTT